MGISPCLPRDDRPAVVHRRDPRAGRRRLATADAAPQRNREPLAMIGSL